MSDLLHTIVALEEELLRLDSALERIASLLLPEFREIGSSGRLWTRDEMLAELVLAGPRTYRLSEPVLTAVADDACLLTYRVEVNERVSCRSSLWVRREGAWGMLFHQGTIVPQ